MKNIWTVFRKEIGSYFNSPTGYLYIIAFVSLNVGLFITPFFSYPQAGMRSFFSILPLTLCIFVPAVTMRLWAAEKSDNTYEMLLTLPMKPAHLVMGKYLASLLFYLLSLAGTLTIPLMLAILGNPDTGAILGGYLGAFLVGALFLALGLFISGFCEDQMAAFVVTLGVCLTIYLAGQYFVIVFLDGWITGLGTGLKKLIAFFPHYEVLAKGVIEVVDVFYFLVWSSLFLFLNAVYLEGRRRPKAKLLFATSLVLCMGIGITFNILLAAGGSFARLDITENRLYTLSPATKDILSQVKSQVRINLYLSPAGEMPSEMKDLEKDITDKLEAIQALAGKKKFTYHTIHMKPARLLAKLESKQEGEEEEKEKSLEERLLEKGVQPFAVRTVGDVKATSRWIYSSIGIAYKEKAEEILPEIVPAKLPQLEYELMNIIYKLAIQQPKVVLVAPKSRIPESTLAMYRQLGLKIPPMRDPYRYLERILKSQKYEVQRVELNKKSPLPDDFDLLAVVNPRNLSERQQWEINRSIVEGRPIFLVVQNYEWDYQASKGNITVSKGPVNPGVSGFLESYGLGLSDKVLMDVNHGPLTVSSGNALESLLGGGITLDIPIQIVIKQQSMNKNHPITKRLSSIYYLWGSALTLQEEKLKENGLKWQVLLNTSKQAWEREIEKEGLSQDDLKKPGPTRSYPLMVLVEGQFPDAFAGQEPPPWPSPPAYPGQPPQPEEEEEIPSPTKPAKGKLLLLGCSQVFEESFLNFAGHVDLFLNSIDTLSLGEGLTEIRSKKIIDRSIPQLTEARIFAWKLTNYLLVNIIVVLVGIVRGIWRRKSRERYKYG